MYRGFSPWYLKSDILLYTTNVTYTTACKSSVDSETFLHSEEHEHVESDGSS
jgi:hypothetical protein